MKLAIDKAYGLCTIASIHNINQSITKDAEQICALEFYKFSGGMNKNPIFEVLILAVLQFVCKRHGVSVDFAGFMERMEINPDKVERWIKNLEVKYENNYSPNASSPSKLCSIILDM